MDDRRVADYFVIAGLPENPKPLEDFSRDGASLKSTHNQAPITDVAVIFPASENVPEGYTLLATTPTGLTANLNHGSIRSPNVFLCYRRGRDRPPLVDIGVYYDGKERVCPDVQVVTETPTGRQANVNNSGSHTFITYRRASDTDPCNTLVVTDICIILLNKGEIPPHTFLMLHKNLNKGMLGSDVFLCYKKSMNRANSIAYQPATLGRCPSKDHSNFPLPQSVPMFCLPMGATVECWPHKAQCPDPVFSTFVLTVTVSDALEKVYGAAITFYENCSEDSLSQEQKLQLDVCSKSDQSSRTIRVNKCMCILSHWPFFDTFEKFLRYLHRMSVSGPHTVPIERYISHFMLEVPFPSPQRPRILIQLDSNETIALAQPEDSPLPLSGASFKELLKNLGPDNCMTLLLYTLTEQKILVHSLRPDVLTSVAEAISMLIFPFHWPCPYIPLCPLGLSDVLCAPMPFIVGVDSRYFDLYDPPSDVFCVDLDTSSISLCDDKKFLSVKLLPKKPARVLKNTLFSLFNKVMSIPVISQLQSNVKGAPIDREFNIMKQENMIELEIQEAYLRFMATILKGFRSYLMPITKAPTIGSTDPNSLFDIHGFLKSRDKTYHRFYNLLMKTQMFTRFIEERSFVSDKDACLAFFDECTEKVDLSEGKEVRLIEPDESQQSDRTVFVPLPDTTGLPNNVTYSYDNLGRIDTSLFLQKQRRNLLSVSNRASPAPSSPMARRTKQEIRTAQKLAKTQADDPRQWVKCLKRYCYCLWFIHLPAYVKEMRRKSEALNCAFDVLHRTQVSHLQPLDEVCYRVLMQLCGQYGEPLLAIKLYSNMKHQEMQLNAVTYGYYNKAIFESKWPTGNARKHILWNRLRNVIMGVAQFRQSTKCRPTSTYSESDGTSCESGTTEEGATRGPGGSDVAKHDDRGSTGGQSDVGYSSMNLDETQKSTSSVNFSGTQVTSESTDNEKGDESSNGDSQPDGRIVHRRKESVNKDSQKVRKLNSVDFSECNDFRLRVGSIVCNSRCNVSSLNGLNSMKVSSVAGILMTAQGMYDDVFVEDGKDFVDAKSRRKKISMDHCDYPDTPTKVMGVQSPVTARLRHGSSPSSKSSPIVEGASSPGGVSSMSQECDSGAEFLRSGSFASDAHILSHLSQGSTDTLDAVTGDDDVHPGRPPSDPAERWPPDSKERSASEESHDTCPSPVLAVNGEENSGLSSANRSPSIPVKGRMREGTRSSSVGSGGSGSLVTSPQMTPVTQNDPLGVFTTSSPIVTVANGTTRSGEAVLPAVRSMESPAAVGSESRIIRELFSAELFRNEPSRRSVNLGRSLKGGLMVSGTGAGRMPKSSTFGGSPRHLAKKGSLGHYPPLDELDVPGDGGPGMHRSHTLPNTGTAGTESVAGLGGGGLGGSRSSVGSDVGLASPLFNQLSSMVSSRFQTTGFHNWKSVAASKLSEIKEAISTSRFPSGPNTPSKINYLPRPFEMEKTLMYDDDEESNSSRRSSVDLLTKGGRSLVDENLRGSSGNLDLAKPPVNGSGGDVANSDCFTFSEISVSHQHPLMPEMPKITAKTALEIQMTTCSKCLKCRALLYDEEIMANWTPEESNLNTICPFCKRKIVPLLTVVVKDYRSETTGNSVLSHAQSTESMQSAKSLSLLSVAPSRKASDSFDVAPLELSSVAEAPSTPETKSLASEAGSPLSSPLRRSERDPLHDLLNQSPGDHVVTDSTSQKLSGDGSLVGSPDGASPSPPPTVETAKAGRLSALRVGSVPSSVTSSNPDLCSGDGGASSRTEVLPVPSYVLEPINLPYLSPIVLRKELETVLDDEGDICLALPEFVDKHPIMFWNLLWYCIRIGVHTHLAGLCLKAKAINKDRQTPKNWVSADSRNVVVRCMWDHPKLHEDLGTPMYMTWSNLGLQSSLVHALVTEPGTISKGVIQQIISGIQCNDLGSPLKIMVGELRKREIKGLKRAKSPKGSRQENQQAPHRSVYRDLLFLAITVLGRQQINLMHFDKEYRRAFAQLTPGERDVLGNHDRPPSDGTILCRQFFAPLEL